MEENEQTGSEQASAKAPEAIEKESAGSQTLKDYYDGLSADEESASFGRLRIMNRTVRRPLFEWWEVHE